MTATTTTRTGPVGPARLTLQRGPVLARPSHHEWTNPRGPRTGYMFEEQGLTAAMSNSGHNVRHRYPTCTQVLMKDRLLRSSIEVRSAMRPAVLAQHELLAAIGSDMPVSVRTSLSSDQPDDIDSCRHARLRQQSLCQPNSFFRHADVQTTDRVNVRGIAPELLSYQAPYP